MVMQRDHWVLPTKEGASMLPGAFKVIPTEEQWGGLVFTGEGNGLFKAYNSATGELMWQDQTICRC